MDATLAGSGMVRIGDHLIERLQALGVDHVFGVPGDFVLGFMHRLEVSPITLITTCDEQGAGFAADAYARVKGLGAVCVTYGVGGLKIANTTGQAYAEESPVVVISGAPGMEERRRHELIHHKVRNYETQYRVFRHLTAAATVLDDPTTALHEIDRVLDAALATKRPVYIELPRSMDALEVPRVHPVVHPRPASEPRALAAAVAEATTWIANARQPVIVLGFEVHRFGVTELANRFVDESGIPTTVMLLDKSAVDERHPSFIGVYAGQMGRDEVREYVEESDCVILLGSLLSDVNLGGFTAQLDPTCCIHATHDRLAMGLHTYEHIDFAEFVEALADHPWQPRAFPARSELAKDVPSQLQPGDPVTVAHLFHRLGEFLDDDTIVLADPGDALFGAIDMPVHASREFLAPAYYASLGFAVPAAIGAQFAAPGRRPLVLVGDGAFQMTGMELSTIAKYGLDPVIVVLNNNGYTTERLILDGAFNDIHPWDYSRLPELLGAGTGYKVRTAGDLELALAGAAVRGQGFNLIEVCLETMDVSPALRRLGERLNAAASSGSGE